MTKPKFKIGDVVVYSEPFVFEIIRITEIKIEDNYQNIIYNNTFSEYSPKGESLRLATTEEIKLYVK